MSLFSQSVDSIQGFSHEGSACFSSPSPSSSISPFTSPSGNCSLSILKGISIVSSDPKVGQIVDNASSGPKVANNSNNGPKVAINSSKSSGPKVAINSSNSGGPKVANNSSISSGPKVAHYSSISSHPKVANNDTNVAVSNSSVSGPKVAYSTIVVGPKVTRSNNCSSSSSKGEPTLLKLSQIGNGVATDLDSSSSESLFKTPHPLGLVRLSQSPLNKHVLAPCWFHPPLEVLGVWLRCHPINCLDT